MKTHKLITTATSEYGDFLKIGLIQTVVDEYLAWNYPKVDYRMNHHMEISVWQEIKKGFCNLKECKDKPDIIVMPELTVPHGYTKSLVSLSKAIGSVVIAGLDFEVNEGKISNKAIVIVPQNWPNAKRARSATIIKFGKTFFSEEEKIMFKELEHLSLTPSPDPVTCIFDAGKFGKIGVAICSDFFDLERFIIYRGKIHHMIVIAHNKDTNSFYFLAEAISRLVYCNVVICNTGYYGDSLVFSPYDKSYERIIYRHEGQNLFSTQVIKVPVKSLDDAQGGNDVNKKYKSRPPCYKKK